MSIARIYICIGIMAAALSGMACLVMPGCQQDKQVTFEDTQNIVSDASTHISDAVTDIRPSVNSIKSDAKDIIKQATTQPAIKAKAENIEREAGKITSNTDKIENSNKTLEQAKANMADLSNADKDKDEKIAKLEKEKNEFSQKAYTFMLILASVGIAASVAALFFAPRLAMFLLPASVILFGLSIWLQQYEVYIKWISPILVLGCIVLAAYSYYKKNIAVKEITTTVDEWRQKVTEDAWKQFAEVANTVQSNATKKVVDLFQPSK